MKLLTKEILKRLPLLGATEGQEDPIIQVKFFTPDTRWKWYGIEFDQRDTFYGYVEGQDKELGFFYLSELEKVGGTHGLGVERDMYFSPCRLSKVRK